MPKIKVKCIRCSEEMSLFKSAKQKRIYNRSFCMDPTIPASQIFCDRCMYELYIQLVYSVVDFLNESHEIQKGLIPKKEKEK